MFWRTIGPESLMFNLASFNLQKKDQILNSSFLQYDFFIKGWALEIDFIYILSLYELFLKILLLLTIFKYAIPVKVNSAYLPFYS